MQAVIQAARNTARLFHSQRKLWIPFLITVVFELLLIGLVWLAPQAPFSKVLAPPIRYFTGEQNLHYPWHLWFLYHAMKHTHLLTTTLVGAYMGGIACVMVRQTREGQPLLLRAAIVSRRVHYGRVLLLWLITWGIATGALEVIGRFAPKSLWTFWGAIGLSIALQALLSYVIPAAVYQGGIWRKALLQGVRETLRYPFSTLAVVIIPSSVVIFFAAMAPEVRVAQWMAQTTPELVVVFVALRLVLWTASDGVLTVGIAHLWWAHRAQCQVVQAANVQHSAADVSRRNLPRAQEGSVVA